MVNLDLESNGVYPYTSRPYAMGTKAHTQQDRNKHYAPESSKFPCAIDHGSEDL